MAQVRYLPPLLVQGPLPDQLPAPRQERLAEVVAGGKVTTVANVMFIKDKVVQGGCMRKTKLAKLVS